MIKQTSEGLVIGLIVEEEQQAKSENSEPVAAPAVKKAPAKKAAPSKK